MTTPISTIDERAGGERRAGARREAEGRPSAIETKGERLGLAAAATSVISAFIASACCVGPLVFALLGIGGAGFLVKLEPYRPYFVGATVLLLGTGFWLSYRKPKATADCEVCEVPRVQKAGRVMLWVATLLVAGFLAFPYLAPLLFE